MKKNHFGKTIVVFTCTNDKCKKHNIAHAQKRYLETSGQNSDPAIRSGGLDFP